MKKKNEQQLKQQINRRKQLKSKVKKSILELNIEEKEQLKAVALKYEIGKDKAPKVIALGQGEIAKSILELAEKHDVPMFEDKSMAQLLSSLRLNRQIPKKFFPMVAEILSLIFQMDKDASKRLKIRKKFVKI